MNGWRATVRSWLGDMVFGVRLAVTGARGPWGRLALTAVGIGLGVAVLLLAASVPTINEARSVKEESRAPSDRQLEATRAGDPAMLTEIGSTGFRDARIRSVLLDPQRPDAPVPPGLSRNPGPGESVVSPELARVLNGPDGDLLRPRLGDRITGVIGKAGLVAPNELFVYTGTDALSAANNSVQPVYRVFGEELSDSGVLPTNLHVVLALGVTALLVPVVVFVASTTRLAEAARQRRLAALRLVGASSKQVRRIAAGEALLGSVVGVLVGWTMFLVGRLIAGQLSVVGFAVFVSDIMPSLWYCVTITLAVPVIAVGTSILAMQRTIIEPLGVVRRTELRLRRIGWRCAPIVLGVVVLLLLATAWQPVYKDVFFVSSVVLILIGVPLVLPWVVERVVQRLGGATLSWQLAVRRLQLTSTTAARSVSVIAVVLTGVIGLQTLVATMASTYGTTPAVTSVRDEITIEGQLSLADQTDGGQHALRALSAVPGVHSRSSAAGAYLMQADGTYQSVTIADCPSLAEAGARRCRDGDAFATTDSSRWESTGLHEGKELYPLRLDGKPDTGHVATRLPLNLRPLPSPDDQRDDRNSLQYDTLVLTPALAEGIPAEAKKQRVILSLDPAHPEAIEAVRNIAAEHFVAPSVDAPISESISDSQVIFTSIRYGLLLGSLVTFALIGCGLFVAAAEQIQERRRPMAILGAVGVRRVDLARSALLQNLVPMLAATVVSVVLGMVLGALVVLIVGQGSPIFDFVGMAGLVGIALLSVLVVTGLTLPMLGRAMEPEGLRTE